jgi:hypothetical protein
MPAQNAIDRLFASEQKTNDYTVDEMLEEDDDMFLDGMSDESKSALYGRVTPKPQVEEVTEKTQELPIQQEEENIEEDNEEPVEEVKRGRGRPRKETVEQSTPQQDNDVSIIMDALCMSVIEDLTRENYKFMNFTKEQTIVILNYMKKKLGE